MKNACSLRNVDVEEWLSTMYIEHRVFLGDAVNLERDGKREYEALFPTS